MIKRRSGKKMAYKPIDVDDKDFLDMMMTEANEEEEADILGEKNKNLLWKDREREEEAPDEKE